MSRDKRQLALDFAFPPVLDREAFMVSPSNRAAFAFIDSWPEWPYRAAVLVGPEGSGKTHLAAIWREKVQARIASAAELTIESVPALLASGALVLEDAPGHTEVEQPLFHVLNLAGEQGVRILMTSRTPPAAWRIGLPDLRSRVSALPAVEIGAPDETLLRLVLGKHLADRQLSIEPGVIDYIIPRMERSFEAARRVAQVLDRLSLESRRSISRPLAAEALAISASLGEFH